MRTLRISLALRHVSTAARTPSTSASDRSSSSTTIAPRERVGEYAASSRIKQSASAFVLARICNSRKATPGERLLHMTVCRPWAIASCPCNLGAGLSQAGRGSSMPARRHSFQPVSRANGSRTRWNAIQARRQHSGEGRASGARSERLAAASGAQMHLSRWRHNGCLSESDTRSSRFQQVFCGNAYRCRRHV